jgi:prophage maintenance system killer protein
MDAPSKAIQGEVMPIPIPDAQANVAISRRRAKSIGDDATDIHGSVALFDARDSGIRLDVRLEQDAVWLSQVQMAQLFQRDRSVISKHTRNVFREGELPMEGNVQKMHIASADKPVALYSLDVVISVGYRVKSHEGTLFRIWATRILKEHLIRGYTLETRRLRERGLGQVHEAVCLLSKTLTSNAMVTDEGSAALDVVRRYTRAWTLLLAYDEERLSSTPRSSRKVAARLSLEHARYAIERLRSDLIARREATELFGLDTRDYLAGIVGAIEQTFEVVPVYSTVQERGAHLLYFTIKDHPFTDGNKRIGLLLFLEYLRLNDLLLLPSGLPRLTESAVVALALLIAESEPKQKGLMISLTVNLLESQEGSEH